MIDKKNTFPVMESFYTIQGEGFNTGKPAYFIRLGGCDVGCTWCDVKESWDADAHPQMTAEDIIKRALEYPSRFAVITGGEPALYNLSELCNQLHGHQFSIAMETSGAYKIEGHYDWICVSPKKFKFPSAENLQLCDELKVVVYNESDFKWAEENAAKVKSSCRLYLQPEYSRFDKMIGKIIEYIKDNPEWSISLQTHKVMNIP